MLPLSAYANDPPTMLPLSAYVNDAASGSVVGRALLNSDTSSFNNHRVTVSSAGLLHINSCRDLRRPKIEVIWTPLKWKGCLYGARRHWAARCFQKTWSKESSARQNAEHLNLKQGGETEMVYTVGHPRIPPFLRLNAADQAFLLLTFTACLTTGALVSLVVTAIPTLNAMTRAALSLEKLADTAREELPGTMAAIRLTGMEISDLTLELSDLSQEVTEGVRKSARAFRAAEVGIRRIGGLASSRAISMLQERANLPVVSMKPAIAGVAQTTSQAIRRAQSALWRIIPLSYFSLRKRGAESESWQAE